MSHFAVGAAFLSSTYRQCYMFVKKQYVVLDYSSTSKKDIIHGPGDITDGFPMLVNTVFENGIDCAFEISESEKTEVFIFSGNICAKIKYTPRSEARILKGPISIAEMFPCLVGTPFVNGINAAIRYDRWNFLLFKGDRSVLLSCDLQSHQETQKIARRFSCLYGTVFESGIDAAFLSNITNGDSRFFIFKGERCACIDHYASSSYNGDYILGGRITRISDDWPALHEMFED